MGFVMGPARVWVGQTEITEYLAIDWSAYRKCAGCGAVCGQACRSLSGTVRDGRPDGVATELDTPHRARKRRAGR